MRCLRVLVVAAAVLGCGASHAGAVGETVHLMPRWAAGDICDLEITRTFEDREDEKVKTGRSTSRVRLKVLELRADGYLIEWRVRPSDTPSTGFPTQPPEALRWLTQQQSFRAEMSASGRVTALRNMQDIRATLEKVVQSKAAELPAPTRDAVLALLRKTLADDEAVRRLLTADLGTILTPVGMKFRVGRSVALKDVLPDPMGGGPHPARGKVSLTQLDRAAGTATIASHLAIDPKSLRESLKRSYPQAMTEAQATAVREVAIAVENRHEHVIDTASGWPVKVRRRKLIQLGAIRKMEGLQVTATLKPFAHASAGAR